MKFQLVCFDLNKTLISENTWYELNLAMGMTAEEDQALFALYQKGELTYVDWQKELERIYIKNGKATRENISKVIYNYTYRVGAKEVIEYLKSKGYTLALISGSIDVLVERVARECGISHYLANNTFVYDKNNYLKEIKCLGGDVEVKGLQLRQLCEELKIDITQVVCVGDGDNDFEIFKLSGHGITFEGSKIEPYAWKTIGQLTDLRLIL
ncbi:MAG: HAD family phosphatase [Candidatus Shapirobacteria bacterium]|jgi:phosphoserine phosphatase